MGLFGFGKKREKSQEVKPEATVDRDAVLAEVEAAKAACEGLEGKELGDALNRVGALYASIDEVDDAIKAYERSLVVDHVMGKASTALVKLYNKKRAAAAEAKDDAQIAYYMDKVNEMLALSKDQLRGRA